MAAIHFTVAISQSSETILDGFTVYGPAILTTSVYLMSLLFASRDTPEEEGMDLASPFAVAARLWGAVTA